VNLAIAFELQSMLLMGWGTDWAIALTKAMEDKAALILIE
jgi:hypothetical protein